MSVRVLLVAAPLVFLFFPAFVVAAGINVTAVCMPSYSWTFNSLGQSPCIVAANMIATCFSGSYGFYPLQPGQTYSGPTRANGDKCECSTVGFSLITACVVCQDRNPLSWSEYVGNCTSTLPPSQFPNPVPAGIYVPHWAILDVTNENNWNPDKAYTAGDSPEYGPGAIFGPSGVYTSAISSARASSTGSPSLTAAPKGSSSNVGAIAGGVVGGIAMVSIVAGAIFYLRRRSRSSMAPSSPYTPDEQTTFQGYAGVHSVDPPALGSTSSHVESGNMHTSLPQTRRYHGLPMPAV